MRTRGLGAGGLVAVLVLAGCTGCAGPAGADRRGGPTVVASTGVWASVVRAVAGPAVSVEAILDDPTADPHAVEIVPADTAALLRADLVVWNGGGRDDAVGRVLDADPAARSRAIEAFPLRGDPADTDEHVGFDLVAVRGVVARVTDRLAAIAPTHADDLRRRASAVTAGLDAQAARLAAIGRTRPGASVVATEPVAHHLLRAAGVADATPRGVVEAVEHGTDPAPAAIAEVDAVLATRRTGALVSTPEGDTEVTERIRDAARRAGVPVVEVTETLPAGADYLPWLDGTRAALAAALGAPAA